MELMQLPLELLLEICFQIPVIIEQDSHDFPDSLPYFMPEKDLFLNLMLVNRLFFKIVQPILYSCIGFSYPSVASTYKLLLTLCSRPDLVTAVRSICFPIEWGGVLVLER